MLTRNLSQSLLAVAFVAFAVGSGSSVANAQGRGYDRYNDRSYNDHGYDNNRNHQRREKDVQKRHERYEQENLKQHQREERYRYGNSGELRHHQRHESENLKQHKRGEQHDLKDHQRSQRNGYRDGNNRDGSYDGYGRSRSERRRY